MSNPCARLRNSIFALQWDDALAEVVANAEDMLVSSRPAPMLAAEIAAAVYRVRPDAELLGFWFAEMLLAQKFRWPVPAAYADAIATSVAVPERGVDLNQNEAMVPVSIAYHQPVTRAAVSEILGREVSRDVIGALRDKNMITAGPRSPSAGAPFTYVTTKGFWSISGSRR